MIESSKKNQIFCKNTFFSFFAPLVGKKSLVFCLTKKAYLCKLKLMKERQNMKKFALIIAAILLAFSGFAQKQPKYTMEDAKQFYHTMQGDYVMQVNDSTTADIHITPIWESQGNGCQWLYLEASRDNQVFLQKVLELRPKTEKLFRVFVHDLKNPTQFVGKWGNPNYFDGFTSSILKSGKRITFVKTHDFSYQTTRLMRFNAMDCFPKGDLLHFKFVQEDERFYVKRVPKGTNRILGYQGLKELTD